MNPCRGFGLLEILISLALFSLGIAMQSYLFLQIRQNMSSAENQRLAWRIAEQKFDDLHDFYQLQNDADFDYSDIQSNQGGKQLFGNLLLPAGKVDSRWTGNNKTAFDLSWQVENGYWQNSQLRYDNLNTAQTIPDQKRITLNVSWFEAEQRQQISVQGIVAAVSPNSEILLYRSITSKPSQPAILTSSTDNSSDSVSIAVNEHLNQRSKIRYLQSDKTTELLRDSYDNQGKLLQQTQFLTVSCQCQFDGYGTQKTAAYADWNPTTQTLEPQTGNDVYKARGCELDALNGACTTKTDSVCQRCCRDHHDPELKSLDNKGRPYCNPSAGVFDQCYDPFRDPTDYTNGQHKHYNSMGLAVSSGPYLESCRLRAIKGNFEVFQDWHRLDMTILPLQWLSDNTARYQSLLTATLKSAINNSDTYRGQISPTQPVNNLAWPDKRQYLNWSSPWILNSGENLMLSSRGLYLDYLNANTVTALKQALAKAKPDYSQIPFYEIPLNSFAPYCQTDGSGWCSSASQQIEVGAGNANQLNGLSAGMLRHRQTSEDAVLIHFGLKRSNSGLTPEAPKLENINLNNADSSLDIAEFQAFANSP